MPESPAWIDRLPPSPIGPLTGLCGVILILTVGCAGRYVGPGSGARDEREQQREERKATSTDPVDPRVTAPQTQREIDNSGIPAGK